MVNCTSCGRPIEKIPSWLKGAKVEFVCDNCPNRQIQNIASVQLVDPAAKAEPDETEIAIAAEDDED